MKDITEIFQDGEILKGEELEKIAYTVQAWLPVKEGTQGGLFFGTTNLMPGKVGNEYFMTKGHFHSLFDRAEFYWDVKGEGTLILMVGNATPGLKRCSPKACITSLSTLPTGLPIQVV